MLKQLLHSGASQDSPGKIMNLHAFSAAIVFGLSSGIASSANVYNALTASVTGLDPYLVSSSIDGSMTRFVFELPDGVLIPKIQIKFDIDDIRSRSAKPTVPAK